MKMIQGLNQEGETMVCKPALRNEAYIHGMNICLISRFFLTYPIKCDKNRTYLWDEYSP
ncbi:hypothetical protein LBYZC6_39810 [Lacrimispora brassicae]